MSHPPIGAIHAQDLTTEHRHSPLGVDAPHPRLRWTLRSDRRGERPAAYRVLVASTREHLHRNEGDVWDTRRVAIAANAVEYAGPPPVSGQGYHWKVQVWDRDGRPGPWSKPAYWEMGLLEPSDWTGRWIARAGDLEEVKIEPRPPLRRPLPIFAKPFRLDKAVSRARLYVTGVGRYEARLNGRPINALTLEPGDTEYEKTVEYRTYDVTALLRRGENVVGLMLGNGIYNVGPAEDRYLKFTGPARAPKAIAQLDIEHPDGSHTRIGTDASWRVTGGPVRLSHHYGGEDYDAGYEHRGWDAPGFGYEGWESAVETAPRNAEGRLTAARQPPVQPMESFAAQSVNRTASGAYVVDMGRNFAGVYTLRLKGAAGDFVKVRPAEMRKPNGEIDQSTFAAFGDVRDTYRLRDGEHTYGPRFVYHGFRYLEVTGYTGDLAAQDVVAVPMRAANPRVGAFEASSPLINSIHGLVDAAVCSNMYSVFTDCPHREKLGWLEAAHLMFHSIAYNFDAAAWYEKLLGDMRDAQLPNGLVPDIAPEYVVFADGFRDDPNWGGAYVLIPWYLYQTTGDTRPLREHFDGMRRYVDYLTTRSEGHILSHGLGDWIAPDETTPLGVTATTGYYQLARVLADAARLLEREEDARRYGDLADNIHRAFNERFYNAATGSYGSGNQASNALALYSDLVPEGRRARVLENLVADIRKHGNHLTVGDVALRPTLMTLAAHGRSDVVWDFLNLTDHPSYGYQVNHGATTLTELWDGPTAGLSQNHAILGHIEEWFYGDLAGLRPAAPGWSAITVKPFVPASGLTSARAQTRTPLGPASSAWMLEDNGALRLNVMVPVGAEARIHVPAPSASDVREGDRPASSAEGVRFLRVEDGCAVFAVGSGSYVFTASSPAQTD